MGLGSKFKGEWGLWNYGDAAAGNVKVGRVSLSLSLSLSLLRARVNNRNLKTVFSLLRWELLCAQVEVPFGTDITRDSENLRLVFSCCKCLHLLRDALQLLFMISLHAVHKNSIWNVVPFRHKIGMFLLTPVQRMSIKHLQTQWLLYESMHSAHTLHLCVPYGSHNKQRLFPQTALTGAACFL
jgi:hypothetical protein